MDKNRDFTPPDGGYGWIVILAITIINICVHPLVQCFGIIYQKEFENLGISAAQTSFLLHLHSAIYCSLGLFSTPLLKKYDFRRIAILGCSLMATGIFLSSFAKSYGILICTVSLIGVGQGIMLPATYLATNTYFKKRLTLAVSFSATGVSISAIFMPQVCNLLLAHFGNTQTTVLVLAAMSVVAILCCFLLKPIKITKTEELQEIKPDVINSDDRAELEVLNSATEDKIYKETTQPVRNKDDGILTKIYQLFDLELLKHRPYVITIIGLSLSFASELNILVMLAFILPELAGFQRNEVAMAVSVQSIADIIGRLAIPIIGHYFSASPKVMYASSLATSSIGRIVISIFYQSKSTIYFCACLFGLAKGTKAVYQSVIIPRYVTLEKFSTANGINMLLTGAASLIIGPIIGVVHDISKSYVYALHTATVISMSCMLLWLFYYLVYERKVRITE